MNESITIFSDRLKHTLLNGGSIDDKDKDSDLCILDNFKKPST